MRKDQLQGSWLRQPLHPWLVHFPIGLWVLSFVLDVASLVSGTNDGFVAAAFYSMAAGMAGALLAAIPGLIDYLDIRRDHPAKRIGTVHMALNILLIALYGINLGFRWNSLDAAVTPWIPLVMSVAGLGVLSASGYFGGAMIYDDGIGVGRHRRRSKTPETTLRVGQRSGGPGEQVGFVPVADVPDLGEDETLRAAVGDTVMTLVKLEGKIYAFQEFCTHRFGPLSEGSFHDGQVECPWHRSCFDVRTGRVTQGPAKVDLKTFATEVRDGKIWVRVR